MWLTGARLGVELVLDRFATDGSLPGWDLDPPAYTRAGLRTHKRAWHTVVGGEWSPDLDVWNRQCMAGSDALAPARGSRISKDQGSSDDDETNRHDWTNRPALTSAAGLFALVRSLDRYGRVAMPDMSEDGFQSPCIGRPALHATSPRQPLKTAA